MIKKKNKKKSKHRKQTEHQNSVQAWTIWDIEINNTRFHITENIEKAKMYITL